MFTLSKAMAKRRIASVGFIKSTGADDDDPKRIEAMADILGGLFGDDALKFFDPPKHEKAWNETDHPRGKNGKFMKRGGEEAVSTAHAKVKEILKGGKTAETHKQLIDHLSILTTKQIHEIKKKNGLKASGRLKAKLVEKLALRLNDSDPTYDLAVQPKIKQPKPLTVRQLVRDYGGFNVSTMRDRYDIKTEFIENGMLGLFNKKASHGIDVVAQTMRDDGVLFPPQGMDPEMHLYNLLQKNAVAEIADIDKEHADAAAKYYEEQENARREQHEAGDIAEAIRSGEAAADTEIASGEGPERFGYSDGDRGEDGSEGAAGGEVGGFDPGEWEEKPAAVASPAKKEPWEMTWDEATVLPKNASPPWFHGMSPPRNDWQKFDVKANEDGTFDVNLIGKDNPQLVQHVSSGKNGPDTMDSIWRAGGSWNTNGNDYQNAVTSGHRSAVDSALAAGKPVPPEVLADYPDLAAKYGGKEAGKPAKEPQSQDAKVEQKYADKKGIELRRAPVGGATSDVDGVFYAGGRLMPIHGLSPKVEKKPVKQAGIGSSEEVTSEGKENPGGRGGRAPMSPEDIEAERSKREAKEKWTAIRSGPIGQFISMGENPHHLKRSHPGLNGWQKWADTVPDSKLAEVRDAAKEIAVNAIAAKEGDGASKEYADYQDKYFANDPTTNAQYMKKRHVKEKPTSGPAVHWVGEAIENGGIDAMHKLHGIMSGKTTKSFRLSKSFAEFRIAQHLGIVTKGGITKIITDKLGRKRKYVDGKQVPMNEAEPATAKQSAPKQQAEKKPKPPTPKQQAAAAKKELGGATKEMTAAQKAHAAAQKKHDSHAKKHATAHGKHEAAKTKLAAAQEAHGKARTEKQKAAASKRLQTATNAHAKTKLERDAAARLLKAHKAALAMAQHHAETAAKAHAEIVAKHGAKVAPNVEEKPVDVKDKEPDTQPHLNERVRDAIRDISGGKEAVRVTLEDLRNKLADMPHDKLTEVVRQLSRGGELTLYPFDDPRNITPAAKAAAIMSSTGEPQHILYFGGHSSGMADDNGPLPEVKYTPARLAEIQKKEKKPQEKLDAMRGHPLAGMTHQQAVAEVMKYAHPGSQQNDPWKLGASKVDPGLSGDVMRAVNDAKSKNSFARPTIKEAFDKVREKNPELSLLDFQKQLAGMSREGQISMSAFTQAPATNKDIQYSIPLDKEIKNYLDVGSKPQENPPEQKPAATKPKPPAQAARALAEKLIGMSGSTPIGDSPSGARLSAASVLESAFGNEKFAGKINVHSIGYALQENQIIDNILGAGGRGTYFNVANPEALKEVIHAAKTGKYQGEEVETSDDLYEVARRAMEKHKGKK